MKAVFTRLAALSRLVPSLSLTFIGIVLLSLGVAYLFIHAYRTVENLPEWVTLLTLQFLPRPLRGILLLAGGIGVLLAGIWQLSGIAVIPLKQPGAGSDEVVIGYEGSRRPRIVVLSGGAGMLILGTLSTRVERMTCIVPATDPVEYYYRASGLLNQPNVYYVVPTPEPLLVTAQLNDGSRIDVRHISDGVDPAARYVERLELSDEQRRSPLTRLAAEALRDADAIILGPGSLFESILPNFLIDEFGAAVRESRAAKIYICNLMTEPGQTGGFGVADHIRAITTYAGITPDFVLVNAQRIDPETTRLYAAAAQSPIYLDPEDYEELTLPAAEAGGQRRLMIEGSVVIESDLSAAVIQYTTSLANPAASRAVRVLRHDGEKLAAALLELLRRS